VTANGKVLDNGTFTLWTKGVIGDYIVVPSDGNVTVTVTAAAQAVDGVGARAAVELTPLGGAPREVGVLEMASKPFSYNGPCEFRSYTVAADVPKGYYTVALTHLNRDVSEKKWRHLFVKEMRFGGAHIARLSTSANAFLGDIAVSEGPGTTREIATGSLRACVDPRSATWFLTHTPSGSRVLGVRPVFCIGELSVDLATYEGSVEEQRMVDSRFGDVTRVTMQFRKPRELDITYVLLFSHTQAEAVARLDFTNRTGSRLRVSATAAMAAQAVSVGGAARSWALIGDGKEYNQPYSIVNATELEEFGCWWYAALKNAETKRSLLVGSLQNNKGMGRFVVVPGGEDSVKLAAYHDYEGITMPPDASITGEMVLLQFGKKGTDSLERFGELIAAVHRIHLRRDFPLDPYDPVKLCLYNGWGGYGASVVSRFPYKDGRDPTKGKHAYRDTEWSKANRKRLFEHCPARLWDILVEREFGSWHVVALFNTDHDRSRKPFTHEIRFEDLELDPNAQYLVYEFWNKTFLGIETGGFRRTLTAPDCEVYSIVEKKDHPVLISTSRHIRHMAHDILALNWDAESRTLSGTSKLVKDDPYQLRIFVPTGFVPTSAEAGDLAVQMTADDALLTIDIAPPDSTDVRWRVAFEQ